MKAFNIRILAAILLSSTVGLAQTETDEMLYKAYLTRDFPLYKQALESAKSELSKKPADKQLQFNYAMTGFALLSGTMGDQDEDMYDQYEAAIDEKLEALVEVEKKWGEPKALLAAKYGLDMGYSPMKGMYLGAKSNSLIEKAIQEAPTSALVWKVQANSKFFTPEMFGGDLAEAIKAYEKAIGLYESTSTTKKNWMYIDALAFLGQAYSKNNEVSKAIATYEKALKIEPDFGWVKFLLLPKAQEKLSNK